MYWLLMDRQPLIKFTKYQLAVSSDLYLSTVFIHSQRLAQDLSAWQSPVGGHCPRRVNKVFDSKIVIYSHWFDEQIEQLLNEVKLTKEKKLAVEKYAEELKTAVFSSPTEQTPHKVCDVVAYLVAIVSSWKAL